MSKGHQRRSQCDVCPAVKRVILVKVHGDKRLNLCEACRLAYSKIARDLEAEKQAARRAALHETFEVGNRA